MMLFEFSLNLDEELTRPLGVYHVIVPSSVVAELTELAARGDGVKSRKAKAALQLSKQFDVVDVNGDSADTTLVTLAAKMHGIVVTNDRELKKRLQRHALQVIYLRSKHQLVLE